MLQAFKQISILEKKLKNQVQAQKILDYRISLKTDMRLEVYLLLQNIEFDLFSYKESILSHALNFREIDITPITEREKNYDPLYSHIFSDNYPNINSKVDLGLVWRFDTLLSNASQYEKPENPCNVVTFYSYKGGMGRTTTLCSYAIHLAQMGKKVVIIDCDFEAPGFLNFFNTSTNQGQKNGLIEYLLDKEFVGKSNLNLKEDYLINIDAEYCGENGAIYAMPAGNLNYKDIPSYDDESDLGTNKTLRLNLYNYIHGLARLNLANTDNILSQFRELFEDLKLQLDLDKEDYILIDSRTGFNEIFGITALNLSNLIVGLFGSSEQTRPGLYFLLDKYRELIHQPKMVLLNSIIPNEAEVSKKFKESFERLLNTYVDAQDVEWNPIASIPIFSLHENKVLKQIGVQFYDQDDLNYEKEKELLQLIHSGNFINNKGANEEFEDLNLIFKQLDDFTIYKETENIQIDTLSVKQLRQIVLEHLVTALKQDENGSVAIFAEDKANIDVDTFFYRDCMKELFKKDKFLIQGFKGSGKTYLYKALKDKKITEIILKKANVDNKESYHFIDIIELKGAINNYKQFPFPKEEVKSILNLQAFWKVYLWTSIMLDISENEIFSGFRKNNPETQLEADLLNLKNSTETERKIIFKKYIANDENLVIVERDLKNLNDYLSVNKIRLFVLFDQLDKVANLDDWSLLITPLVEFIRDNYNKPNFTNIFPKIFLRTDIFPRIATNNSLSITTTSTVKIEWEPIEMYAYLFNLIFASDKSQQAFFKLMREYQQYPVELIEKIEASIKINGQPPLDQNYIEPLLNTFFGNDIKSPKGLSLGSPFKFFFMNFSNADETVSLRPFINLLSDAVNFGLINDQYVIKYADGTKVPISPSKYYLENPPMIPILHYYYSTNPDIRDKATKEHFDDLTKEPGNDPIKYAINYIKSSKIDRKYKKVVLTNIEVDNLLEEIINFPEYNMKETVKVSDLKKLLVINGIAVNDEKYKIYRFAQMYKYWLGLSSRKEESIESGQLKRNKITYINYLNKHGRISAGYKVSDLFFHASMVIGNFNNLKVDDMVEFTISKNEKGLIATQVRRV